MRNATGQFEAIHTAMNVVDTILEVIRANANGTMVPFLQNGRVACVGKLHSVWFDSYNVLRLRVLMSGGLGGLHDVKWKLCGSAAPVVDMLTQQDVMTIHGLRMGMGGLGGYRIMGAIVEPF